MIEFVPALALLALVKKGVDLLRYLRGKDYNGAITILAVWILGVTLTIMFAQSDYASGITSGDLALDQLNIWSLVLVGLTVGASASLVEDTFTAIDSTRSGEKPSLTQE